MSLPLSYGEVFAGIGAANAAFLPLGWENKFFIENDTVALAQYLYNWDPQFSSLAQIATGLNFKKIYSLASSWQSPKLNRDIYDVAGFALPKVDILMTSPPCQSFSVANTGGSKGLQDKGDLFFETHRIIGETLPPVFILENVPGMVRTCEDPVMDKQCATVGKAMFGSSWKMITNTMKGCKSRSTLFDIILPSLGERLNDVVAYKERNLAVYRRRNMAIIALKGLPYQLFYRMLDASDYGAAPLSRKRIFIVGFRNDLGITDFSFPTTRQSTLQSVYDYVQPDAPLSTAFRYKKYPKGSTLWSKVDKAITKVITPDGQGVKPRLKADKRISTLTTKLRESDYNTGILMSSGDYRSLADEQMRALMGFPLGFNNSSVSFSGAVKNFGNSISVPVLRALGRQIENTLKNMIQKDPQKLGLLFQ